jgi:hypothetical protein
MSVDIEHVIEFCGMSNPCQTLYDSCSLSIHMKFTETHVELFSLVLPSHLQIREAGEAVRLRVISGRC